MLVKKIGKKVLIDSQLYKVLFKIAPLMLLFSLFSFLAIPRLAQRNQFQQPTLKLKLYDLPDIKSPPAIHQILSDYLQDGVKVSSYPGRISGQCLVLAFKRVKNSTQPPKILQKLAQILRQQSNSKLLSKTVTVVLYDSNLDLASWLSSYHSYGGQYGTIRAALNFEFDSPSPHLFYRIYGYQGKTVDTDFYFTVSGLLNLVSLKYKPCESRFLNTIKRVLNQLTTITQTDLVSSATFLQYLYCSLIDHQSPGVNSQLLEYGIQSVTLKVPSSESKNQLNTNSVQTNRKLASVAYSWIRIFSYQQDNLHSSSTLWYPVDSNSYLSVKFYIIPPLVFLLFAAVIIIYRYYVGNMSFVRFRFSELAAVQLLVVTIDIWLAEKKQLPQWAMLFPVLSLVFLIVQARLFGKRCAAKYNLIKLLLAALSMLVSVYLLIYYPVWSFVSGLVTLCLLFLDFRKLLPIIMFGFLVHNAISPIALRQWAQVASYLWQIIGAYNIGLIALMPLAIGLFI